MEQMSRNLAFQLKKIRQQRSVSLDDVAKATGVSKAQLAQIEKGEANPTVSTIWKIAAGLRISFSSLLQPPIAHFMKFSSKNAPHVDEDEGRYRVYSIIPYDPERGWEFYKVEMEPGARSRSEAHTEGVEETVTVIHGQAVISAGVMHETITEGETLVFSGHQAHEYQNVSEELTVLHVILQYK
ncbi:transcriptional regulator [Lysinibacillus sphaericus]|uniref:HTH-type transcriptional regulator SutR n=1 Tax=Lysinibacillus sphaericus TaxID=1421 RepID=A0A2S5D4J7_LYSSH|nr:XRE family transcriptional regulator [Lysinibacillus sphaericus]OEC02862.1 transcriptional regulator [Lysinibacillus sphaericus]POZ57996.1 HTH-type transcriptional regulator SutR [Lysinibacillus sphaericus]